MVPQTLAALDQAEISDEAMLAAAHASETRPLELIAHTRQHPTSMHCLLIPSNLDGGSNREPFEAFLTDFRDAFGFVARIERSEIREQPTRISLRSIRATRRPLRRAQ